MGCNNIEIRKSESVAKSQFLYLISVVIAGSSALGEHEVNIYIVYPNPDPGSLNLDPINPDLIFFALKVIRNTFNLIESYPISSFIDRNF